MNIDRDGPRFLVHGGPQEGWYVQCPYVDVVNGLIPKRRIKRRIKLRKKDGPLLDQAAQHNCHYVWYQSAMRMCHEAGFKYETYDIYGLFTDPPRRRSYLDPDAPDYPKAPPLYHADIVRAVLMALPVSYRNARECIENLWVLGKIAEGRDTVDP